MKGVVSAGHDLTAKTALDILRGGGNAFDAAVAAAFTTFVCESTLTSPGGSGFLMAHIESGAGGASGKSNNGGSTLLYDFFSNVPGKGGELNKEALDFCPTDFHPIDIQFADEVQVFTVGRGAVAVPGVVAGLEAVHQAHCTMSLEKLMAPAISYAFDGVILNKQQAYFIEILSPLLTATDEGRSIYQPSGTLLKSGDRLINKGMAEAFSYLSKEGLDKFYRGDIGDNILKNFSSDNSNGGLITKRDLTEYNVEVRDPLHVTHRGRTIYTNPPPSSGGSLIAFTLKMSEVFNLSNFEHNSSEYLEALLKTMKLTDLARAREFDKFIYDDDVIDKYLSDETLDKYKAMAGIKVSDIPSVKDSALGSTTHLSVVDKEGNAASITTSTGTGCSHMIPGTGIMMNNMLGEEDLNPHGFHVQPAGVRMSSMMAPTIVMNNDVPELVLGSGGSNRIRNAIAQVILNSVDMGMGIEDAVSSSRVHFDGTVYQVEGGINKDKTEGLTKAGVKVNHWADKEMYFGGVHTAVMKKTKDSVIMEGIGDKRRGGVCLINKSEK